MCLHMNFLPAELTKCLHPLIQSVWVCVHLSQLLSHDPCLGVTWYYHLRNFPISYIAGQCSVFFVQRIVLEVLCHAGSWTCTPLPPSLPILPALQDPMRLEVTHPDLGAQLPCDKHC